MTRFLDNRQVRDAVHQVIAGDNVRCAVAFWGNGALKALFRSKKRASKARIVCDLTMGGTNPEELALLGAPTNELLKHVEGLHAKLYLSTAGLVVTSANASNRGIGFLEPARLVECGTFHAAGTKTFAKAEKWFELLWKGAEDVDADALATARAAWAKRPNRSAFDSSISAHPTGSMLAKIAADPDRYRGIGVVFSSGEANEDDVRRASTKAIKTEKASPAPTLKRRDIERLPKWPTGNLFTGWSDIDARAWPAQFLCAHRGARGALSYWCYDRLLPVQLGNDDWSIFAERSPKLRSLLGLTGTPRSAAVTDAELLTRIFAHLDAAADADTWGSKLCESPIHLGLLLAEVRASSGA